MDREEEEGKYCQELDLKLPSRRRVPKIPVKFYHGFLQRANVAAIVLHFCRLQDFSLRSKHMLVQSTQKNAGRTVSRAGVSLNSIARSQMATCGCWRTLKHPALHRIARS